MSAWRGKYVMQARRELWEHRALWLTPAIVAGVVLVSAMLGFMQFGDEPTPGPSGATPPEVRIAPEFFGRGVMFVFSTVLGGVTCVAVFAYLLDCLYAERKDRSILFWKSLPVSDSQTVLTKLAVGLVIAPLAALVVSAVALPLLLGALNLRFEFLRPAIDFGSVAGGYALLPQIGALWLYAVLWYAPVLTYLMLASALANRVPLMFAVLPPTVLSLMEALLLGGHRVAEFFGTRLAPWAGDGWEWRAQASKGMLVGLRIDWARVYGDADLWLGLLAAAAMVFIMIRLRRYRDDT